MRGYWFVEQIPDGLILRTLGVQVNGQPVTNFVAESGQSGDVYPGYTPCRWVIESPATFSQNNPVPRYYWDWQRRKGAYSYKKFCGTPPQNEFAPEIAAARFAFRPCGRGCP